MSDGVLYLYQVLLKYLIGFRVTDLNSRVDARVLANVDGRTYGRTYGRMNGRKLGSLYRTPCLRQARQKYPIKPAITKPDVKHT